ncbi:MAG TPA: SxtJ family membrane protein [Gemmatimonadales bacterium]
MEPAARPGLSAAEGRRFAWTLAAGFAAIGALARWRGGDSLALALWGVAVLAFVAGVAIPARLGPVQRGWMALGVALSRVTTPVFYTVLYLLVVTPTGIVRRTFGRSPISRAPDAPTYWVERPPVSPEDARRAMEHQF